MLYSILAGRNSHFERFILILFWYLTMKDRYVQGLII
jgi:hypothetical protein